MSGVGTFVSNGSLSEHRRPLGNWGLYLAFLKAGVGGLFSKLPGEKGTRFKVALLATATAAERQALAAMRHHGPSGCRARSLEPL